mmetsp:Transcript_30027/g.39500  ORF Transcript_30027/g.39500 Transcript_30027/m.39500 type:complete len:298 (+) Transcript_30027:328-1221(+)|eukprot:CAMPEP_0117760388 /NCGR_PEP_ID=MMETSP0947-20121206/16598_1 /TAXON_ID=44440 /ORGANISM="Chattonella subsalsa, Strain CCMP2191" /LENGTH=297 /DNA_ID=CAMNT_0005581065 /DNA_START=254 /DNA_END=1147 /DNA_ORIENTATION=+
MPPEFDTFLSLLAFLYLYFFFLVPNVVLISTYYVYDPTYIWTSWGNYISQLAIVRWPAYIVVNLKKWHDDWHHRQSERLGNWKFMYMPTLVLGAVTLLQVLNGSPIPVTYVIGHRLYPAFHDGDVVLMSGRRSPKIGDSVLYLNTSIPHSYLSSKIPVITASEDDALQIRRIEQIKESAHFDAEGKLQALRPHTLVLCAAGDNLLQPQECAEVPVESMIGVATLRVPWAALPLRYVQKLGCFLEGHTRIGQPASLWKIIHEKLAGENSATETHPLSFLGQLELSVNSMPSNGIVVQN